MWKFCLINTRFNRITIANNEIKNAFLFISLVAIESIVIDKSLPMLCRCWLKFYCIPIMNCHEDQINWTFRWGFIKNWRKIMISVSFGVRLAVMVSHNVTIHLSMLFRMARPLFFTRLRFIFRLLAWTE